MYVFGKQFNLIIYIYYYHIKIPLCLSFVRTGARVNAKDNMWLTPLHRAVASRSEVSERTYTHAREREPRPLDDVQRFVCKHTHSKHSKPSSSSAVPPSPRTSRDASEVSCSRER